MRCVRPNLRHNHHEQEPQLRHTTIGFNIPLIDHQRRCISFEFLPFSLYQYFPAKYLGWSFSTFHLSPSPFTFTIIHHLSSITYHLSPVLCDWTPIAHCNEMHLLPLASLFLCFFVCLSVCLSVSPSLCLSLCLFFDVLNIKRRSSEITN
jgi:hypothetical protein